LKFRNEVLRQNSVNSYRNNQRRLRFASIVAFDQFMSLVRRNFQHPRRRTQLARNVLVRGAGFDSPAAFLCFLENMDYRGRRKFVLASILSSVFLDARDNSVHSTLPTTQTFSPDDSARFDVFCRQRLAHKICTGS
jgi:hypothetical protein